MEARGNRAEALGIYAAAMQALLPGFSPPLAEKAVELVKRTKPLLPSSPPPAEAGKVRNKIYELEYKPQQAGR